MRARTVFILFIVAVLGTALVIILFPRFMALIYQVQGGKLLEKAMAADVIEDASLLFCQTSSIKNISLDQAISKLNTAIEYRPTQSQPYLLLGRAYLLQGEYDRAASAYSNYVRLRPANPLGHLEKGEAYIAFLRSKLNANLGEALNENPLQAPLEIDVAKSTIIEELGKADIVQSQWINNARKAFSQRLYEQTLCFYQVADLLDPELPRGDKFLWSLATIVQDDTVGANQIKGVTQIYDLQNDLHIAAKDLQWVEPFRLLGEPLKIFPGSDPAFGVMWWNGSAVAVVHVYKEGNYQLTLRARSDPPAPINISIEHNLLTIDEVSLSDGDSNWKEVTALVSLSPGLHIIGVKFINDETINNINRNAVLDWIGLSPR